MKEENKIRLDKIWKSISPFHRLRVTKGVELISERDKVLHCLMHYEKLKSLSNKLQIAAKQVNFLGIDLDENDTLDSDLKFLLKHAKKMDLLQTTVKTEYYTGHDESMLVTPQRYEVTERYVLSIVDLVKQETKQDKPPYNIDKVVSYLNIFFRPVDSYLLPEFDISKHKNGPQINIVTTKNKSYYTRCVIKEVAYLLIFLGYKTDHYHTHCYKNKDGIARRQTRQYDTEQKFTKIFIEEFLLPRKEFISAVYSASTSVIEAEVLAQQFGVHKQDIIDRCNQLQLIEG